MKFGSYKAPKTFLKVRLISCYQRIPLQQLSLCLRKLVVKLEIFGLGKDELVWPLDLDKKPPGSECRLERKRKIRLSLAP